MRQAIQTKYLGPTDRRGSRYKAWCDAGSITINQDHSINFANNHRAAAHALAEKLGWSGEWIGGGTEDGYVFVTPDNDGFIVAQTKAA